MFSVKGLTIIEDHSIGLSYKFETDVISFRVNYNNNEHLVLPVWPLFYSYFWWKWSIQNKYRERADYIIYIRLTQISVVMK